MARRKKPKPTPTGKPCVDCIKEGITTVRKTYAPGPRCDTHLRARKRAVSDSAAEKRWLAVYGISAEEYWDIFEFQQGRCYICRRANGKAKRLSVDHDHRSGIVRGLLCTMCNKYILGWARDCIEMLQRAIDYLRNPPAVQVIGERLVPNP